VCPFSEVYHKFVRYDVFREGWAIPNSEKSSSGVSYVRVVIIWRGRGREGIFVVFPYTVTYTHERV
jgi:hypothetical protein